MLDLTNQTFGLLTLKEIVGKERKGYLWRCECECGGEKVVPASYLRNGHTKSCGCLYKESRKDCTSYRNDFVENTCLSSIVAAKTPGVLNTSGHTGVYFDKRSKKWQAYINYRKKRHYLGSFEEKEDAICTRKEGEAKLHDPVIMEHFDKLTPERKKEFIAHMKSIGKMN